MKGDEITQLFQKFEAARHDSNGVEYWSARDLQWLLGYERWSSFTIAIEKAKVACERSGAGVVDHFQPADMIVDIGSKTTRTIDDIWCTRYACYLLCQNGDPSKEPVAFAQTYFAVQTRKQELIEQRLLDADRLREHKKLTGSYDRLSEILYERGLSEKDFSDIREKGDEAFFGGRSTKEMKKKHDVPKDRPLEDFLSTLALTAKDLAAQVTGHNVVEHDLSGVDKISKEHIGNNQRARNFLTEGGIKPEDLPPAADVNKVRRSLDAEKKKLLKDAKKKKDD